MILGIVGGMAGGIIGNVIGSIFDGISSIFGGIVPIPSVPLLLALHW